MQKSNNWINQPLFIVGHPKSGTSLLTSLLDSHPQLMVLPEESDFYNQIWPKVSLLKLEWRKSKEAKTDEIVKKIIEESHFKNYFKGKVADDISGNLEYDDINTSLLKKELKYSIERELVYKRQKLFKALIKVYTRVINKNKDKSKIKYWVEKTPKHLWFVEEIKKDFPNAKIIFVYRDPRDNYLSYKKKWPKSITPIKFSKNWNESIDKVEGFHINDLLKVKYEDLILNPKDQISRIILFLDIEYDSKLFEPTKNGKSWQGNSMFGEKSKNINSKNIGRYEKNLSRNDIEIIEFFCKDKMIKFRYKLKSDSSILEHMHKDLFKEYDNFNPARPNKITPRQYLGRFKKLIIG